jgi:hypothetical protein
MEQCRIKTNLPLATVRNQADKKKQVFTIAVDAQPDERLRFNDHKSTEYGDSGCSRCF